MARPKQRLPMPPKRVGTVLDSSTPSSDSTACINSKPEKEEIAQDLNSCEKPKNWLEELCEEKSESPTRNKVTAKISDVGGDVGIEDFDSLGDFEFGDQKMSNSDAAEVLDFDANAGIGTLDTALELSSDGGNSEVEETFMFICTTCGYNIDVCKIQRHPQLGVGICKQCKIFLYSGPFTKDVDGYEEQCRWCGQGGEVVLCDKCDKAFCKLCIVRNFGAKMHAHILNKKEWKCFFCDPEPLEKLVIAYEKLKKTANSTSKSSSSESDQKTLQDAFKRHKTVDNKPSGRREKVWTEWKQDGERVDLSIEQILTRDLKQEHPKVKEKTKLHQKLSRTEDEFGTEDEIANYPITTPCQPENESHGKFVRSYLRPHMLKRRRSEGTADITKSNADLRCRLN